jgi:SAM-dependent methyltransferase
MSQPIVSRYVYKNFNDYETEFNNFKNTIKNPNYMNGEYNTLHDLPFKYINIIKTLEHLHQQKQDMGNELKINTLVDPGCAYSSLSAYIAKIYNCSDVYLFDFDVVSDKNIRYEQNQIYHINNLLANIHFYGGDFYNNINKIPDSSIDLVIDGCSITHFCGNKGGNESWNSFCKYIYPKLNKNGHIIIATDINNSNDIENASGAAEEFLYPTDIIHIFEAHGFKLIVEQSITPVLSNDIIKLGQHLELRVACFLFIKS